jgi:hypothetical protein
MTKTELGSLILWGLILLLYLIRNQHPILKKIMENSTFYFHRSACKNYC